jgi:adenylosuccinate synthase
VKRKLDAIRTHYMVGTLNKECNAFLKSLNKPFFKIGGYELLNYYDTLVFEGNQGVLLDMDHGIFPDVTYSSTTSKNAIEICNKIGVKDISIYHVTRAYHTRHGRGEFEENPIKLINIKGETNKFNPEQGVFKTAKMDYELLNSAIAVDMIYSGLYTRRLIVTCNDQIADYKDAFNVNKLLKPYLCTWYTYSPDTLEFNN